MPVLADFAGCDHLTFPNGSPMPCNGTAYEPEKLDELPPTWVAAWGTHSDLGAWCFYRKPAEDLRFGFRYRVPDEVIPEPDRPIRGALLVESGNDTRVYQWTDDASDGDHEGVLKDLPGKWEPDVMPEVRYRLFVYQAQIASNRSDLENGTYRQMWTTYHDRFWLNYALTTSNATYRFSAGNQEHGGIGFSDVTSGQDFFVSLRAPIIWLTGTSAYFTPPEASCPPAWPSDGGIR